MGKTTDCERGDGFGCNRTAELVGIRYRQLGYWAPTRFIVPLIRAANGSGSRREYSYGDLVELRTITKLLVAGIQLE